MTEHQSESKKSEKSTSGQGRPIDEIGEILTGIGRSIEEGIRSISTRGNVLNVRVDDRSLEAIDALISAGIFKTRSEAAANLIEMGIEAKASVFAEVANTARKINELRDEMKDTLRRGVARQAAAASAGTPDLAKDDTEGATLEG